MLCCESPGKSGFFFSSWQAYCEFNAGERVDMELISQHIRRILERNTMGCLRIEENIFSFSPVIHHQLQVCVCGIYMSLG